MRDILSKYGGQYIFTLKHYKILLKLIIIEICQAVKIFIRRIIQKRKLKNY